MIISLLSYQCEEFTHLTIFVNSFCFPHAQIRRVNKYTLSRSSWTFSSLFASRLPHIVRKQGGRCVEAILPFSSPVRPPHSILPPFPHTPPRRLFISLSLPSFSEMRPRGQLMLRFPFKNCRPAPHSLQLPNGALNQNEFFFSSALWHIREFLGQTSPQIKLSIINLHCIISVIEE